MRAFYKQKAVHSQNSGVLDSVAECDWYKMRTRERKMFVFLLHNCQHPCVLSVGGYADLNMSTCLAVRVRCRWRKSILSKQLFYPDNEDHLFDTDADVLIIGIAIETLSFKLEHSQRMISMLFESV